VIEVSTGSYPKHVVTARERSASKSFVLFRPAAGATVKVASLENLASRVEDAGERGIWRGGQNPPRPLAVAASFDKGASAWRQSSVSPRVRNRSRRGQPLIRTV
jgi:hypothetical protein